jgi:hypothetical protein
MAGLVPAIHVFNNHKNQDVDARDIGEPSGLVFGKPNQGVDARLRRAMDRLRDAVLRTAMRGHDESDIVKLGIT